MEQATNTKSFKQTREDAVCTAFIIEHDPRVTRGPGEVLRLAFEDAALQKPDWNAVIRTAKTLDLEGDASREGATINFSVDPEVFSSVCQSVREQLNLLRPRTSFVARLCLQNTCLRLQGVDTSLKGAGAPQSKTEPSAPADPETFQREMDAFAALSIDEKLNAIYAMLLKGEH